MDHFRSTDQGRNSSIKGSLQAHCLSSTGSMEGGPGGEGQGFLGITSPFLYQKSVFLLKT